MIHAHTKGINCPRFPALSQNLSCPFAYLADQDQEMLATALLHFPPMLSSFPQKQKSSNPVNIKESRKGEYGVDPPLSQTYTRERSRISVRLLYR